MKSWCCQADCYETPEWFICRACGAKKAKASYLLKKLKQTEIDLEPLHAFNRALYGDVIWRTRIGEEIPVKELRSSHLLNIVRMLKGQSPHGTTFRCDDITRHNWIQILTLEAERRGLLLD